MENEYQEMNYYEDIFSVKPSSYMPLIGYDKILSDVFYLVRSGNMVFIEGEQGSGKSSILMRIIKKFKGQKKVAYVDCQKTNKFINIEKTLTHRSLVGKIFKVLPKDMIVLLDNVEFLTKRNSERIKYFFDHNNIKSVVFTAEKLNAVRIPESLKHRLGKRIFTLPKLNSNSASEILFSRIEEVDIMDNRVINKLYSYSDYNPKKFLQNCMRVFDYAENEQLEKITLKELKGIINE